MPKRLRHSYKKGAGIYTGQVRKKMSKQKTSCALGTEIKKIIEIQNKSFFSKNDVFDNLLMMIIIIIKKDDDVTIVEQV